MVYEGEVELVAELPDLASGALLGEVRVQACTDTVCLPPATLPLVVDRPAD